MERKEPKNLRKNTKQTAPPALEKSITDSIMKYLKSLPNSKWEKRHGSGRTGGGKPDITGCMEGLRFELEVKRPGIGRVSKLQEHELEGWKKAGAVTAVVTCKEDVMDVLEGEGMITL